MFFARLLVARFGVMSRSLWLLCLGLFAVQSAWAIPEIQRWQTRGGTPVLFIEAHELPMVDVEVVFNAGAAREGEQGGLAALTNAMLSEGAAGEDAARLAARFEDVGAQFGSQSLRDMSLFTVRSLSREDYLNAALAAFEDVLGRPDFPADALERLRKQMLIGLDGQQQSPRALASRLFMENLFKGHAYGSDPSGTKQSLESITGEQVEGFYRRFMVAQNAVIALVGDLDRAQAEAISERLATAMAQGEKAAPLPVVKPLDGDRVVRKPYPSSQTHIYMGAVGISRHDPDYYPLVLGNHALGGSSMTSLLFDEIRNQRGLSYGVGSRFTAMQSNGPFTIAMQTRNDQVEAATKVLREQLHGFVDQGISQQQLDAARQNLIGSFPLSIANNSALLSNLALIGFYDLPDDYLDRYVARMEAVTVDDVRAAFRRHLNPDRLLTVIVGGGAQAQKH